MTKAKHCFFLSNVITKTHKRALKVIYLQISWMKFIQLMCGLCDASGVIQRMLIAHLLH
jgi:hypothetical protein